MWEMNESEPLMNASRRVVMSKPKLDHDFGTNQSGDCRLDWWHPVYRRHEPHMGGCVQLRDPFVQVISEKAQGATTPRLKVAILANGADQIVRAMNAGNSAGAKDLDQYSGILIQLVTGGNQGDHQAI